MLAWSFKMSISANFNYFSKHKVLAANNYLLENNVPAPQNRLITGSFLNEYKPEAYAILRISLKYI